MQHIKVPGASQYLLQLAEDGADHDAEAFQAKLLEQHAEGDRRQCTTQRAAHLHLVEAGLSAGITLESTSLASQACKLVEHLAGQSQCQR